MNPRTTPIRVEVRTPRYTRKQMRSVPPTMKTHQRLVGNDDCSEFHSPATRVAELQHDQRDDQDLDGGVGPADEEPDRGGEADGVVRGHRTGRGDVLGELADAPGGEQHADEGDADGQREGAGRERRAKRDRRGDGGAGGHRSDGLEEHVEEPDGIAFQLCDGRLPGHLSAFRFKLQHSRP